MTQQQQIISFILRGLKYFSLIVLLFGIFYVINNTLFTKRTFKIPSDKKLLICGPSIFRSGINPDLLPGSVNISQDEELYPMTALKLKTVLKENPHIKTVILALNPGLISKKLELLSLKNPVFEKEIIERLYPISHPRDYAHWPIGQKTVRQVFFQQYALPNTMYMKGLFNNDHDDSHLFYPYIGTFKAKKKSKINESLDRLIRRLTPRDSIESESSAFLIAGLKECLSICATHNVEVILVNTPLHKRVRNITPEAVISRYSTLESELNNDDVFVLDLSRLPLPDDAYFNATHLNVKGATILTKEIADRLKLHIK